MLYDDKVCTVYRVKNGFVVECVEPAKKGGKGDMPMGTETESYTAGTPAAVLKIVKEKLAGRMPEAKEYGEAFAEAVSKRK